MSKARLMQGNEACVEGALAAGVRFFGGYPITPSTEIAEGMAQKLPAVGGKFVQMEDEIAMNKSETLLTGQQVQDQLNVSRTTLWNWRKDGYLVPIEIGGKYRYRLSDINTILRTSRPKRKKD